MKIVIFIFISLFGFNLLCQDLIPYRKGNKWGYSNKALKVVIKPKYKSASFFYFDKAVVQNQKGKFAYINKKGELLCDFIYDKASPFYNRIGYVSIGEDTFCIDMSFNKVNCVGSCGGSIGMFNYFKFFKLNGKYGLYCNYNWETGKQIKDTIFPIWDQVLENHNKYAAVKKDSLWAIINTAGEFKTGYEFTDVRVNRYDNEYYDFIIKKNGKYGFLKFNGELLIEPKYEKVSFYEHGYASVYFSKNKWAYIDRNGQEYYKKNFVQRLFNKN